MSSELQRWASRQKPRNHLSSLPPLNPDDQDHVEQYGGEVDVEDEKVYCTPPLVPAVLEPWGVEVEIPGGGRWEARI